MRTWGEHVEDVGDLMEPAPLLTSVGERGVDRGPEPQGAVADSEDRGQHVAALAAVEQVGPGLGGFPVPVVEGDQFLRTVGTDPDHDQRTHLVLLEPDLEVDPVDPHVRVVGAGQGPLVERTCFVLPVLGQPGDRCHRELLR